MEKQNDTVSNTLPKCTKQWIVIVITCPIQIPCGGPQTPSYYLSNGDWP